MWPIIHADQSTMDWTEATYDCNVIVGEGSAEAHHDLHKAGELERLLREGLAVWTLEVRCPKTLYSRTHISSDVPTVADWELDEVEGMLFLLPGLCTTEDVVLSTKELNELWRITNTIEIPRGTWLAKGGAVATNSIDSLIRFRRVEELPKGRMEIRDDTSSGNPRFIVSVSSDLFERISQLGSDARDIWVAALIGAFARIPNTPGFSLEDESTVAKMLRIKLFQAGVPSWDEDGWDPTLAATSIEPFSVVSVEKEIL